MDVDVLVQLLDAPQLVIIVLVKVGLHRHHSVAVGDPQRLTPVMVGAREDNAPESLADHAHFGR